MMSHAFHLEMLRFHFAMTSVLTLIQQQSSEFPAQFKEQNIQMTRFVNQQSPKSQEQEAHQLVWQAKRRATKIRPKAIKGGIFGRFCELRQMLSRKQLMTSYPAWL